MFPEYFPKGEEPRPFSHTLFAFLTTIGIILFYGASGVLVHSIVRNEAEGMITLLLQGGGQIAFMLLPALYCMRYSPLGIRGLLRRHSPAFQTKYWVAAFLGILLVNMLGNACVVVQAHLLPASVWESIREVSSRSSSIALRLMGEDSPLLLVIVVVALIPALAEEVLFRGLLQRSLEQSLGRTAAISYTALLFALIHGQPDLLIAFIAIGVLLGALAAASRSLIPAMLCHFANNALSLLALRFGQEQATDEVISSFSFNNAAMLLIVSVLAFVFLLRWILKETTEPTSLS